MAADAVATNKWSQFVGFVQESYHEIRFKTTWPDLAQVRQASIAIIVFVLVIGLVITLLDVILNGIFVQLLPSLFR
jgi:preprotein translocase SecE subunit